VYNRVKYADDDDKSYSPKNVVARLFGEEQIRDDNGANSYHNLKYKWKKNRICHRDHRKQKKNSGEYPN